MTDHPTRVQIWASQLWANDFPPVCAMTGRPAETWRRFKFVTAPGWTYSLLVLILAGGLGLIVHAVVVRLVAQRASGYLPLTRASSKLAIVLRWAPASLFVAGIVSWVVWLVAASNNGQPAQSMALAFALLGVLLFLSAWTARLLVRPLVCPRARVMEMAPGHNDRIVELRNVHPAFVAAVQLSQQQRAQTYANYFRYAPL